MIGTYDPRYQWQCRCAALNGFKETHCHFCNAIRPVDRTPPRVRVPRSKKPWWRFWS